MDDWSISAQAAAASGQAPNPPKPVTLTWPASSWMTSIRNDGCRPAGLAHAAGGSQSGPDRALATYRADPRFNERVRAGRAYGCADRADALRAEHLIEVSDELAVAVVDQKLDRFWSVDE